MGFGWASEGWKDSDVRDKIIEYKQNVKMGNNPTTYKEEIAKNQLEKEKQLRFIKKRRNQT